MSDVSPLSDELNELLDAERALDGPPAVVRVRMLSRLETVLGLPPTLPSGEPPSGEPGDGGSSAPPAPAAPGAAGPSAAPSAAPIVVGASAAWKTKVVGYALSFGLGAGAGATTYAALVPEPSRVAQRVEAAAPRRAPSAAAPLEEEIESGTPAASSSVVAAPSSRFVAVAAPERKAGDAQLKSERLLLEAAHTAIARGDHASAMNALHRHAATFPLGQLAEEREVLLVQALKASGDDAAARERAKAFREKFPGSLLQDAVDQTSAP